MTKWEYKTVKEDWAAGVDHNAHWLNDLGEQGWERAGLRVGAERGCLYIFKRPKDEPKRRD